MSPAYDPKQRRAHSPTAPEGPAPVDELLGAAPPADPAAATPEPAAATPEPPAPEPAAAPVAPTTPEPATPVGRAHAPATPVGRAHAPAPPPTNPGPDPRIFAAIAVAVAAAMVWWRRRSRR